ncbi:MAG TPA: twin-arginine translocase TatA/TatE family subunit [Phycisphaerae bacterium]|nr:twin-arginine translocase TatA/TatE family subunit [Phycisphaerae bacterium]
METLSFLMPGPWEIIIILVVALLLFGRRLPEVGRSLGKGIVEFKKGLKGVEDEIEKAGDESSGDEPPTQG